MGRYIAKRLLLLAPTLFGIILINFAIVQFAAGAPIEQIIAKATLGNMSTTADISGGGDTGVSSSVQGSDLSPGAYIRDGLQRDAHPST